MTTNPLTWLNSVQANPISDVGTQRQPVVTGLTDGRYLISWVDHSNNHESRTGVDLIGQIFDADGTAIGSPVHLNEMWHGGTEDDHDVVGLADGGFIVTYLDQNSTSSFIRYERYDADLNSSVKGTAASGSDSGGDNVSRPQIAYDGSGDAIIVFRREDGGGAETNGVIILNNNVLQAGGEFGAGSRSETGNTQNDVAFLSNGNIVTVNEDFVTVGQDDRIKFTISDMNRNQVQDGLVENGGGTYLADSPRVAALVGGGFVVVYTVEDGSSDFFVRYQRFDNAGNKIGGATNLDSSTTTDFSYVDVVALDDGGFFVGWVSAASNGAFEGRRLAGNGGTNGTTVIYNINPDSGSTIKFEEFDLDLAEDGRILLTFRNSNSSGDIFQRVFDPRDQGDVTTGTSGSDHLTASAAGGTVNGFAGQDRLFGVGGDDTFIDSDGINGDFFDGGGGVDTIDYSGATFGFNSVINLITQETTSGFSLNTQQILNIENVEGSQGGERIVDASGANRIDGNGGNDVVVVTNMTVNGDEYFGGSGTDTFDVSGVTGSFNSEFSLLSGTWRPIAGGGSETASGFENYLGMNNTSGWEIVSGSDAANLIDGNGGMDEIRSSLGVDTQLGDGGNDRLVILNTAHVQAGETYSGGSGQDTLEIRDIGGTARLDLTNLTSIEIVQFGTTFTAETLRIDGTQFGPGLATNATLIGGQNSTLDIRLTTTNSIDVSNLQFSNWTASQLTSGDDISLTGDGNSESFIGASVDTMFFGNGGGDTFHGFGGRDTYDGGGGTDTVSFAHITTAGVTVNLQTTTTQNTGQGMDRFVDVENIIGTDQADTITGDANGNALTGRGGVDIIDGNGGGDVIDAGGGDDRVTRDATGHIKANSYDGGTGTDTLIGEGLDQQYHVDLGNEELLLNGNFLEAIENFENYEGSNGETVTGTGGNNVITLTGNIGNVIDGGDGDDVIVGGNISFGPNDADTITGGKGRDEINGGAGNDILRVAADHMAVNEIYNGGSGLDSLLILDAGIFELFDMDILSVEVLDFGTGSRGSAEASVFGSQVFSSGGALRLATFHSNSQAADHLEIIIEPAVSDFDLGAATFVGWTNSDEITVRGNALNNVLVGNDTIGQTLNGLSGNDTLTGGMLADVLNGGSGLDILHDTAGGDVLRGGADNDRLLISNGTIVSGDNFIGDGGEDVLEYSGFTFNGNFIIDLMAGTGTNNGSTVFNIATIENVENTDDAALSHEGLRGDDNNNVLRASGGNNEILGRGGNDMLFGGSGVDMLNGGSGEDRLDGGLDNDTMVGGTGNDTYIIDNVGDTAVETSINDGFDIVETSVTLDMFDFIEQWDMTGTGDIETNGNDLANFINGNSGNNYINGAAGTDVMTGGDGNDTYTVDNLNDVIIEQANGGDDVVYSENDVQLSGNIETAILSSTFATAVSAFGDANDNQLFGNEFDNVLYGRGGLDRMGGGAGDDIFVMAMGDQAANIQEQITDFEGAGVAGGDRMGFGGFGAGATVVQVSTNSYEVRDAGNVTQASFILEGVTTALTQDDFYFA